MFLCMAAGEIFVNPKMFGGFLSQPKVWPFIFLESAAWLIPFMIIALPMLRLLKNSSRGKSILAVSGVWIGVGSLIVIIYKQTYYPGPWELSQLARADITFGWTIPCSLILALFIFFSVKYLEGLQKSATDLTTTLRTSTIRGA